MQERIAGQLELPISKEYLGLEIDNMVSAYNEIISEVGRGNHIPVSVDTLKALNKQILAGLPDEPDVVPGELRQHSVAAGSYVAAPWEDVPHLLERLCDWLETGFEIPDESRRIPTAVIKAVVAHIYIEWIHPFGNGNGRLGRLVEFLVLISHGVPLPAAHILTSHYNDTRTDYYRQLNEASRTGGDVAPFLRYAAQGFVDGLTETIRKLHRQQEMLMWRALVDEDFIDNHTAAGHRQRLLAIELAQYSDGMPKGDLRHVTPALTEAYASKTPKTLSRDVNRLIDLGFAYAEGGRVFPVLQRVRGMRPMAVTDPGPKTPKRRRLAT